MVLKRKKTTYLFLLSSSNIMEAKGWNVLQAKSEAERELNEKMPEYQKAGMFKEMPVITAYDTFDRNGLSSYNWKRIPSKR